MKRDMDLIREILIKIEEFPKHDMADIPKIEGYSDVEIYYHVMLLAKAGLIEAYDSSGGSQLIWFPKRLTWDGYEFLEAARDNTRWDNAKKFVLDKTGGIAFEILKAYLFQKMKELTLI
jgi:hypothetical protein